MSETYTVERSTVVAADPGAVHQHLVDFHHWPAWSPWEDVDPDMTRTYSGPERGAGAVYEWSGNRRAGAGRMEITEVVPSSKVVIDLSFLKPFKSRSVTTFSTMPEASGTRVTWSMTGPRTLAVRAIGVVTSMDKLVGKDFEKGLARLASLVDTPS